MCLFVLALYVCACLCLSLKMCQRFYMLVSFSEKCGGAPLILLQMYLMSSFEVVAAAPAVPTTNNTTQPLAHPHVYLNSLPAPCRLTINPSVTMATVSMRTIKSVIGVRWGCSMRSHVNCFPSDLVREQKRNKNSGAGRLRS